MRWGSRAGIRWGWDMGGKLPCPHNSGWPDLPGQPRTVPQPSSWQSLQPKRPNIAERQICQMGYKDSKGDKARLSFPIKCTFQ